MRLIRERAAAAAAAAKGRPTEAGPTDEADAAKAVQDAARAEAARAQATQEAELEAPEAAAAAAAAAVALAPAQGPCETLTSSGALERHTGQPRHGDVCRLASKNFLCPRGCLKLLGAPFCAATGDFTRPCRVA